MSRRDPPADGRSLARLRAHYEVEVELADRLRESAAADRRRLYGLVYDELFARVPDHPQLTRRSEPAEQDAHAQSQVALIRQFLPDGGHYVEIGAGDCATVRRIAEFARLATAVEVSPHIVPSDLPPNVEVTLTDGVSVPVTPASADVVYSNQLMEHLHPDDAAEQLHSIATALKPGGLYICITPNRVTGPHDISGAFGDEPRGFHLHEYTYRELGAAFTRAGFRNVRVVERFSGRTLDRLGSIVGTVSVAGAQALQRAGDRARVVPLAPYMLVERATWATRRSGKTPRLVKRLVGSIRMIAER
jgi:SAM-dependent methyltransferase